MFDDKAYVNEKKKQAARAAGVCWAVKEKPKASRRLSSSQQKGNRRHGAIRAKVEHMFRALKCQFGYRKVRYRGNVKKIAPRSFRCWRSPISISHGGAWPRHKP